MADQPTPYERLRQALADSPDPKQQRRLESIARAYTPNALYDRLLALAQREPATFARVTTPTVRMALGQYQACKAAYEEITRS